MKNVIPETTSEFEERRVLERPDGFYWEELRTGRVFGPFDTLLAASNDMEYNVEAQLEPGETLREAENEIGISEWVDPETGDPIEEERPRLSDE